MAEQLMTVDVPALLKDWDALLKAAEEFHACFWSDRPGRLTMKEQGSAVYCAWKALDRAIPKKEEPTDENEADSHHPEP